MILLKRCLPLFLLFFTVFVTVPTLVRFVQPEEFIVSNTEILLVGSGVAFFLFLFFSPMLLAPRLVRIYMPIALTIWIVLVAFVFPIRSGLQIGAGPEPISTDSYIEAFLYAILFAGIIMVPRFWPKIFRDAYAVAGVTAILFPVALTAYDPGNIRLSFDSSIKSLNFPISSKHNIIVVLLDEHRGDLAEEILRTDEALSAKFSGFTFFSDNLSAGARTGTSLPSLMTGSFFTEWLGDLPNDHDTTWLKDAQKSSMSTLYLSYFSRNCTPPTCVNADYFQVGSSFFVVGSNYIEALNMGLLRTTPTFLHGEVDNAGKYISLLIKAPHWTEASFRALSRLIQGLYVDEKQQPTMIYAHSVFTHRPTVYDGSCNYHPYPSKLSPFRRSDLIGMTRCGLLSLARLIDKLKMLNVYSKTDMLFLSDHGENNLSPFELKRVPADVSYIGGEEQRFDAVLMVKRRDDTGPLKFDLRPTSLIDVRNTLCSMMTDCSPSGRGINVFDLEIDTRRKRFLVNHRHGVTDGLEKGQPKKEAREIIEFAGTTQDLPQALFNPTRRYKVGTDLFFGKDGNALHYTATGWAFPDEDSRGTDARNGSSAQLVLPLAKPIEPGLVLEYAAVGYAELQTVSVEVNGERIGSHRIAPAKMDEGSSYIACIPASMTGSERLGIQLTPSAPASPAKMEGRIYDERELGIIVRRMVVREAKSQECG